MLIAVAGCVAQAEGAEIVRRAPAVDLVVGPQNLSPPARDDRARRRGGERRSTPSSRRRQVRRAGAAKPRRDAQARRHRPSHGAGRLRQVLHVLRRALYARRRDLAAGRARSSPRPNGWPRPACARSRCSGRTSMPITARARTARLVARRAAAAAGASARHRAAALHHQPSARHGRRLIAAHRDLPALMPYCICRCSPAPTASSRR